MDLNLVTAITDGKEFDPEIAAKLSAPILGYDGNFEAMCQAVRDDVGASDLILQRHDMPLYIIKGRNAAVALTPELEKKTSEILDALLDKHVLDSENEYRKNLWHENQQIDFSVDLPDGSLARVHVYENDASGPAAAIRIQSVKPPNIADLFQGNDKRLETIMSNILDLFGTGNGFTITGGPVRSGKTTLVHAVYNKINSEPQKQRPHILMIADPPEYKHVSKHASIQIQTIGRSVKTYDTAINGALRIPHQILDVGEFRGSTETAAALLNAALYGSQVNTTGHTYSISESRNRFTGMFQGEQQAHMKAVFQSGIRGMINLRLIPTKSGEETLAIQYINFVRLPAYKNNLDDAGQLESGLDTTGNEFSRSLERDLAELAADGVCDDEVAERFAISKEAFKTKLQQRRSR